MITGVAIKYGRVLVDLPKPNRHHDIIRLVSEKFDRRTSGVDEQGFVDENGNFLNRTEAAAHAISCGQIEKLNWPPYLYSEDLW